MKFRMFEDDPRYFNEPFEQFINNCGSFSTIIHQLNMAFARMGVLADTVEEADFVGFSSGLGLNFAPHCSHRFLIHVWESNMLPSYFTNARIQLGSDYTFFGLSQQISDVWAQHGYLTETIDLGVDANFWKPNPEIPKNEKFTFLSVTACNFRSGIHSLISAYASLCIGDDDFRKNTRLIIKNTEERATKLPEIIGEMRELEMDVTYILERQTNQQLRELFNQSHALVYIPTNTSGGIPILEAAAMELPCVVPDYSPTNIYPHTNAVPVTPVKINQVKDFLTNQMGLPYTFPAGMVDESKAILNFIPDQLLAGAFHILFLDHKTGNNFFTKQAQQNRQEVIKNWTWDKSAEKLVKLLTAKYN